MAREGEIDLIDVTARQTIRLEEYDCVGLASGIYGFEVQKAVVEFARQYLPQGKPVFFVYTYGASKGSGANALAEIAGEKGCPRCWESSDARATTPSAPSNWWAAFPRATRTPGIWKTPADSTGRSACSMSEVRGNENRHSPPTPTACSGQRC